LVSVFLITVEFLPLASNSSCAIKIKKIERALARSFFICVYN